MAEQFTEQVITFDRSQGMALAEGAIDEEAGIIRGVSIATAGVEALGHGEELESGEYREFWTDGDTLLDMLAAIESVGEPLKAKMEHGTGLESIVGEFDNFRIEGDHLRADFLSYPTSKYKDHLFTIAKRLSKQFGVSVTAMLRKVKAGTIDLMRCDEILSADFVDEPAINAALFSKRKRLDKSHNVSNKSLQMEKEEMQSALEEALKPLSERLSKLEDGAKPDEEKLAAEVEEKKDMSAKLESAESNLSEANKKISELSSKIESFEKVAEDAKALGVKLGARLSAETDEPKETFASELQSKIDAGKKMHEAISELRSEKPELCQLEAKRRGLPSINML